MMKKVASMITVSGMLIALCAGCGKADKPAQDATHDHGASCDHEQANVSTTNKWEPETAEPAHKHDEHKKHDHNEHKHNAHDGQDHTGHNH